LIFATTETFKAADFGRPNCPGFHHKNVFCPLNLYQMRFALSIIFLAWCTCFASCKKSPEYVNSIPDFLDQSVVYKTIATIPSPADSAKGLLKDSVGIFRKTLKGTPEFLTNFPGVAAYIYPNYGFSFGYDDSNNSLPYFAFTADAFPGIPLQFQLNKVYEHTFERGESKPVFLGCHNGFDGMTYFVDNIYPPDAGGFSSKTYISVTFTERREITSSAGPLLFGSGRISGYCIDYAHPDPTKYMHRWDFTVDFKNLLIQL
jgi:hypothetical protein